MSPWEIVESIDPKRKKTIAENVAAQLNKQSKERLMNVIQGFVRSKEFGRDFGEPVNIDIVSDYYDFVSAPMDLGTIHRRLSEDFYRSVSSLCFDISLIQTNCDAYNPEPKVVKSSKKLRDRLLEEVRIVTDINMELDKLVKDDDNNDN